MTDGATTWRRRLDWLAMLTFVLASIWLIGIGSLLALHIGRQSLRRMSSRQELRGWTVAWAGIAVAIFGIPLAALAVGLTLTA